MSAALCARLCQLRPIAVVQGLEDSSTSLTPSPMCGVCRLSIALCTATLAAAAALFFFGAGLSRRQPDYRKGSTEEEGLDAMDDQNAALLSDGNVGQPERC